jgi:hypothetical protein
MPGFVDVSNMSAAEVKRLGHADDDYEEPMNRYNRPRRFSNAQPQVSISTRELAAMAFAAQRANGTLHKTDVVFDEKTGDTVKVVPNKVLMQNSIAPTADGNVLDVSAQDRENAEAAITAIQSDIMIKLLKGQKVTDFVQNLNDVLSKETATQRDCGIMAFLPQMYARAQEQAVKQENLVELAPGSQYLGKIGDKVTVDFQFIDQRYLQQFNCFAVFGTDGAGNCVSFLTAHKELAKSARLQGKIKRLVEDQYRAGAKVTTLNYVKEIN